MRKRTRRVWGAASFAIVLFAAYGVASAQMGSQGQMTQRAQLVPREQLAQADGILARMEASSANIQRELESARQARDIVKSLCLNDKLSQMNVALQSARDRRAALGQAVSRNDSELAHHEFTVLDVLRQRVEQLTREASQCIGVDAYYIGESSVSVSIDPTIPQQDTSVLPDTQLVSAPPVCASCVR